MWHRRKRITPGITRPHGTPVNTSLADEGCADAGRVHAVVRRVFGSNENCVSLAASDYTEQLIEYFKNLFEPAGKLEELLDAVLNGLARS